MCIRDSDYCVSNDGCQVEMENVCQDQSQGWVSYLNSQYEQANFSICSLNAIKESVDIISMFYEGDSAADIGSEDEVPTHLLTYSPTHLLTHLLTHSPT